MPLPKSKSEAIKIGSIIYKDGTPYQCFMNDVTWINNSKWGSYAYGPFQWLQMVNRCLYFIE